MFERGAQPSQATSISQAQANTQHKRYRNDEVVRCAPELDVTAEMRGRERERERERERKRERERQRERDTTNHQVRAS